MFSNNLITNRAITRRGNLDGVMGFNPLTITTLHLPLGVIALPKPYTMMGLSGVGLATASFYRVAPQRLLAAFPSRLGLSGGGFPLPCVHGDNHVKSHVKSLPKRSGGR